MAFGVFRKMEPTIYEYCESDFIYQTAQWVDKLAPQESKFDRDLFQRWQAAMDAGAFRHNVDHVEIRKIPGPKKYVALLNILRATEKRKPQQISSIKQPFNPNAFNFTKVNSSEIIFNLSHTSETPNGSVPASTTEGTNHHSSMSVGNARHSIIINNSPVNKGHCLLVPEIDLCKPQVLTKTAVKVALETILLSQHRGISLGFNSLLAFSSVNHLHWHIIYVPQQLTAHYCPVHHLAGPYYEFTTFPVPGFTLQLHGSSIEEVARQAYQVSSYLYENDIAHNVFLCRGVVFGEEETSSLTTVRLFIWPRKKYLGDPSLEPFNLACIELPGLLAIKDPKTYETFTEAEVDTQFKVNSLDPDDYNRIREHVIALGSNNKIGFSQEVTLR